MKNYKNIITLNKNKRGCYILDTVKGCLVCRDNPGGCYGGCYAKNIASRYGFDFSKPIKRCFIKESKQLYFPGFYDTKHINNITKKVENISADFVRIGEMGDPSYDWNHTIDVCNKISLSGKYIVIITKHLKTIPKHLLIDLVKLKVCINTSISALDSAGEIKHRLKQFNLLKNYCKSVLRVVSCEFNKNNYEGFYRSNVQDELFDNKSVIDTVFRPRLNNRFVINKIINIKKIKFLKSSTYASVFNKYTYFGYCNECNDMCGINI